MIRVVCICGKTMRARDEASLRNAVCPSCGCPVNKASNSKTGQKPLTMKDGPLGSINYALVPLWEEGKASSKEVPRYKVVVVDESSGPTTYPLQPDAEPNIPVVNPLTLPARKRRKPRREKLELDTSNEVTFLFPLQCIFSITGLTFLLWIAFLTGQVMPFLTQSESILINGLTISLPILFSVCFTGGFWLTVFSATLRGEETVNAYQSFGICHTRGLISKETMVGMLRCLVCFFAGPVWILGIAAYYWFYFGEMEFVDNCILLELVLVALSYWIFISVAVETEGTFRCATPTGIVNLFRRLGRKTTFIFVLGTFGYWSLIIGIGMWFSSGETEFGIWLPLLISCFLGQVGLSLMSRWLGVCCFLSETKQSLTKLKSTQ